jgi:LysM domain
VACPAAKEDEIVIVKLKSILAMLVMAAITIGIPLVIYRIAPTPWPHQIPNPAHMKIMVQQRDIPDHLIINILAVVLWIVWLKLVTTLIRETVVQFRHRQGPTTATSASPARGAIEPGGGALARLVSIAFAASITLSSTAASAAPTLPTAPAMSAPERGPVATQTVARTSVTPSATVTGQRWVVGKGDSMWSIASAALGDGARVSEIMDLNPNTTVATVLTVGRVLHLPADATVPADRLPTDDVATARDEAVAAASGDGNNMVMVRSGDDLWGIIERTAGEPTTPADVAAVAHANQGAGTVEGPWRFDETKPDLIYPGMNLDVAPALTNHHLTVVPPTGSDAPPAVIADTPPEPPPSSSTTVDPDLPDTTVAADAADDPAPAPDTAADSPAAPAPVTSAPVAASTVEPAVLAVPLPRPGLAPPVVIPVSSGATAAAIQPGDAAATLPPATIKAPARPEARDTVPVALGLAGMSLATTLGLLARNRRRRHAQVKPGHHVPVPTGDLAAAEQVLRSAARLGRVERVNGALRHLGPELAKFTAPVRSQYIAVSDDDVIVMLDVPLPAPSGWVQCAGGLGWRCDLDDVSLQCAADCNAHPWPALVPLGVTEDGTDILIDIEGFGITAFTGDLAGQVLGAMVCSLASSPTSGIVNMVDDNRIVLHGLGQFLENRLKVTTVDAMIDRLEEWVEPFAFDEFHVLQQRHDDPGQMEPYVAAIVTTVAPPARERLERLGCNGSRPISVVTLDPSIATKTFAIDGDGHTTVCGFDVRCHRISSVVADAVIELFDHVDATAETPNEPPPPPAPEILSAPIAATLFAPSGDAVWELGVLGLLRASHPTFTELKTPRLLELFTLLALHPCGLSSDDLYDKVFPDKPATPDKRAATMKARATDLRKVLGNGDPIIGRRFLPLSPASGEQLYRLTDVTVDAAQFVQLLDTSAKQDDTTTAATLTVALELVYGEIGKGDLARYAWSTAIVQQLVVAVTRAGQRLATIAMAAGDPARADWAATQTRLAVPYDQSVIPLAIAARTALGDRRGVRQLRDELDDTHDGDLTPEVRAAFDQSSAAS